MSGPAWTWRHAILEAELPATTKHVLLTISCFMNDVGGGCYRTTKELAQFTGLPDSLPTQFATAPDEACAQHGFVTHIRNR
jgi:hypothetical protein